MSQTEKVDPNGIHVVFGATGAFGYAVARKLVERGYKVRAVARDEGKAAKLFPGKVEIALADVMNVEETSRVCKDQLSLFVTL